MAKRVTVLLPIAAVLALVGAAPSIATAPNNESATYELHLEAPNSAKAPSGDTLTVTGEGRFGVHPKFARAEGEFNHTIPGVGSFSGTWHTTGLVAFQPYGCGSFFGEPIPADLCGGRLMMSVVFVGPAGPHAGTLEVFCLIGKAPPSAAEGIRANVPGVANFNKIAGGENVYVKEG